ncbi:MAG TPA: hypothetical protein VF865_01290 [Acidobacteriaceae bacterium]
MTGGSKDARAAKTKEDVLTVLDEGQLLALLEQARQNVKEIAKRALEGEVITGDLLNMRLRSFR